MYINRLKISQYKNLQDVEIIFDKTCSVFIGPNGSGKSSILEAIVKIFTNIYLDKLYDIGFYFELDYFLKGRNIRLEGNEMGYYYSISDSNEFNNAIKGEIKEIIVNEKNSNGKSNIIPSKIVCYYAGFNEIIKNMIDPINKKVIMDLVHNQNSEKYFFYCDNRYFNILYLILYKQLEAEKAIDKNGNLQKRLYKLGFDIGEIKSIGIGCKQGNRKNTTIIKEKNNIEESDKFWGAKGILRDLLEKLDQNSEISFPINKKSRLFYYYDFDQFKNIIDHNFFSSFELLYLNNILDDIVIEINKNDSDLSIDLYSEGQKQFLTLLALGEIFGGEEECLFLFDEPDVFLHPIWQQDFISILKEKGKLSHYLITTHSPISLTNSDNIDVFIKNDKQRVNIGDLYGQEIHTILDQYMGTNKRPEIIQHLFDNVGNLIDKQDKEGAINKLQEITNQIGENDSDVIYYQTQIDFMD